MKKRTIVILLAAPAVIFLLLEAVLWGFHPAADYPVMEARFVNDLAGFEREVVWKSGEDGLRVANWEDGRPRVLCLGADNTVPVLQSNARAWWGVMATELLASGTPVAVGAVGAAGAPASVSVGWLGEFVRRVKPKVVVLAFGPSEVLSRPPGYRFDPASLKPRVSGESGGWKGGVLKISQVARHLRLSRRASQLAAQQLPFASENALRDRFGEESAAYRQAAMIEEIPWVHDPADEVAETLRTFNDLSKELGFKPVVLWEPWAQRPGMTAEQTARFRRVLAVQIEGRALNVKVEPSWVDNRMRAYRTRAAAVAEGLGIPFVDASKIGAGGGGVFFDETLWTDAGAREVGKLVAPRVRDGLAKP